MLTPKQMLQRFLIALAQVTHPKLTKQYMFQTKEITNKVYNNLINSIKAQYKNGYYTHEF